MKKTVRRSLASAACALALSLQACGGGASPSESPTPPSPSQARSSGALAEATDILQALRSIPGLTVVREGTSRFPGTRFFVLQYDQPVDHQHPEGRRFRQRLTLLHRATGAPTVLAATGYGIGTTSSQTEPTAILRANQLLVEHRFFGPSTPQPATWEHLSVEQAAADHHRIVEAFKPLYSGKWVSTGGSKGGMTSLYHRAFYPEDVDATVAYVAPNSYGPSDPRYIQFLDRVGDADCRAKLRALQEDVLSRREELVPLLADFTAAQGLTYGLVGLDRTLEYSAQELPFVFWQYQSASRCLTLPSPGAPAEQLLAFLDDIVGFSFVSDRDLHYYAAYYHQAASQLGSYRSDERHLNALLRYPGDYVPANLLPFPLEQHPFDYALMHRMEAWVRNSGERILLVYGENDPWSTGAFEVRERNDAFRFFVPGGTHSANIFRLPEPQRTFALERLFTWGGLEFPATGRQAALALEESEELDTTLSMGRRSRKLFEE